MGGKLEAEKRTHLSIWYLRFLTLTKDESNNVSSQSESSTLPYPRGVVEGFGVRVQRGISIWARSKKGGDMSDLKDRPLFVYSMLVCDWKVTP